jgi:hypothetical protein
MTIAFYDGEKQEVPLADPDVEVLDQGAVRLPHAEASCTRAHPRAGDVLAIYSFIDSFKTEPFGLPKCTLHDLMEGLAAPAGSTLLGDLYVALLALAMQAAQQQGLVVPMTWLAESTLNHFTWPELARRWFVCGPNKQLHRKWSPEAVAAAQTLPNAACGAATLPEGHVMMVSCLIEDALDHAEVRRVVDTRCALVQRSLCVRSGIGGKQGSRSVGRAEERGGEWQGAPARLRREEEGGGRM